MAIRPPSAKQAALIRFLGSEPPASARAASNLIDRLVDSTSGQLLMEEWDEQKAILHPDLYPAEAARWHRQRVARLHTANNDLCHYPDYPVQRLTLAQAEHIAFWLDQRRPSWASEEITYEFLGTIFLQAVAYNYPTKLKRTHAQPAYTVPEPAPAPSSTIGRWVLHMVTWPLLVFCIWLGWLFYHSRKW